MQDYIIYIKCYIYNTTIIEANTSFIRIFQLGLLVDIICCKSAPKSVSNCISFLLLVHKIINMHICALLWQLYKTSNESNSIIFTIHISFIYFMFLTIGARSYRIFIVASSVNIFFFKLPYWL